MVMTTDLMASLLGKKKSKKSKKTNTKADKKDVVKDKKLPHPKVRALKLDKDAS